MKYNTLESIFDLNEFTGFEGSSSTIKASKIILGEREYLNVPISFHYDPHGDDHYTFVRKDVSVEDWFDTAFNNVNEVELFIEPIEKPIKCLIRSQTSKSDGSFEIILTPTLTPLELVISEGCCSFDCIVIDGPNFSRGAQPKSFEVNGFLVTLSSLPNSSDIWKRETELKRDVIPTARLKIERVDGLDCPIDELREFLRDLWDFLSFIRSRRCGIGHGIGRSTSGDVSHYLFSFFSSDQFFSRSNWFCNDALVDIQATATGYFEFISSAKQRKILRKVIAFYVSANFTEDARREVALITGYATLEQLSSYVLKEHAGWQPDLFGRNIKSSSMIAASISYMGVKNDPLEHLDDLRSRMKSYKNETPFDLIARFRNSLVHSNDSFEYSGKELLEAFRLIMWIIKLHILYLINYEGKMTDRRRLTGWAGETVDVPYKMR